VADRAAGLPVLPGSKGPADDTLFSDRKFSHYALLPSARRDLLRAHDSEIATHAFCIEGEGWRAFISQNES
jgi:hypothetical protein